jgi:hypothetical protein
MIIHEFIARRSWRHAHVADMVRLMAHSANSMESQYESSHVPMIYLVSPGVKMSTSKGWTLKKGKLMVRSGISYILLISSAQYPRTRL